MIGKKADEAYANKEKNPNNSVTVREPHMNQTSITVLQKVLYDRVV